MTAAILSFRSLRSNALSVLTARLAVPILNLALVITIARKLGVSQLGEYTILVTAFLVLENLKSLGLPTLVVREVARDQQQAGSYHRGLVRIGLAGALLCALGAILFVWRFMSLSLLVPAVILSLGLFPSAYALANDALFLSLGNAQYTAFVTTGENLVRLVLSLAAILIFGQGVISLVAIYAGTRALAAVSGLLLIRLKLPLAGNPGKDCVWTMLRSAPEFLTIFAFPILLFRMDVVLLGFFAGNYAVGIYAVATRLISVCLILPDSIMTAAFAFLSKSSNAAYYGQFRVLVQSTVRWMALILFPITIGGLLFGPFVIRVLFGGRFDSSIHVLKILIWALVPFALNRAMGDALVARGHQRTVAKLIVTTVACSIGFYCVAINWLGISGAAWGFVFSACLLCSLTAIYAIVRFRIIEIDTVARIGIPLSAAILLFMSSNGLSGLAAFVAQIGMMSFCFVAFGFAIYGEFQRVRNGRSLEAS